MRCNVCIPAAALPVVEAAADLVAAEFQLPPRWFNSDVQLRRDALPDEWEKRKVPVGIYGRLQVFALSRPDLIAMKVLAGRPQDLEDLRAIIVRLDDVEFVRAYLNALSKKGTRRDQINDARALLESLEVYEHE